LNFQIYLALFFESIAIFMCVFFLIQYSILKRREHLNYALYLLAISVYYLLAIPELFFLMNENSSVTITTLNLFKRPVQYLSSVFYTFFIIYYLGLNNTSSYLRKFFRLLIALYLVLSVACLLLNFLQIQYNQIYYLVSLMILPLQLYIVFALLKHKVAYSKYIIWGTIMILIGSAITLTISIYAPHTGKMIDTIRIFLPVQVSILVDIFLFTVALQKKIADTEKSLINAAYQRQHAVLLERERIIADLHDDVGGGLSSIRMMSDLLAQQGNTINTSAFAQKISVTAKDIAHRMHTIIWSLNVENDTLENFVEYVRQYGFSFFENSSVNFSCTTDRDLPLELQLKGVLRKNLFLIMKEAFHNILKHAGAQEVIVHIFVSDLSLHILVKDDGIGIVNPNQFGNGLKNMKKRMDEIGGSVEISSNGGTTIKIDVKVS
ncbi:MAG: 7TM diverse intracellular signaling domain-containing protein, partial [Ferruginibacter sp.]